MPLLNHVTLPCGCMITITRHASPCIKHASDLRQIELDNNRVLDDYRDAIRKAEQTPLRR